jgi:hypothetical protein
MRGVTGETRMASLYGIIDAAQDERLYGWIVAEPEHACLFAGKLDPVLARAAPYIVRLDEESPLLKRWQTDGRGKNWGIQCTSDASLAELRRHFRQFLQARLPDGKVVLFRFYDPRVWRAYLPTCTSEETVQWFKHMDEYRCENANADQDFRYKFRGGLLSVI